MVSTLSSNHKTSDTRPTKVVVAAAAVEEENERVTPSKSSKRQPRKKTRSSKEGLKSKNTGIGLSIDLSDESTKQNKKIVFDDTIGDDDEKILDETTKGTVEQSDQVQIGVTVNDKDDDDDAVEEVKGCTARDEIIQQIETEVKVAGKAKKKAKKRKEKKEEKVENDDDEDDDDLDDDFFEELETIKAEEQAKKELESKKQKKGKHTTFVFRENNKAKKLSTPKSVGHNIQVVVLADQLETISDDPFTSVPTSSLTKEALVLSRSDLKDGADQGGKRKRKAPNRPDTTWKRSRKMNLLATPKSRFNRQGARARPAANFVTKS